MRKVRQLMISSLHLPKVKLRVHRVGRQYYSRKELNELFDQALFNEQVADMIVAHNVEKHKRKQDRKLWKF